MSEQARRILIYLAEPTVLDVTVSHLNLLGMDAIAVRNCDLMAETLKAALPDVVLIDLDLEDDAGIRWVERLASDECTAHIPILCLSTQGDLQDAEEAFKCGASDFLIIPYDPILLEDKLDRLFMKSMEALNETEGAERNAVSS